MDGLGIETPWRRVFPHPSRPALEPIQPSILWVPVIPAGKAAGVWRWLSTPYSAEVKERVDLHLYSLSGPLWHYYLIITDNFYFSQSEYTGVLISPKPDRKGNKLMLLSEWRLTLQGGGGKLDDRLRLDVVEIARVPDMLPSLFPSWSG